MSGKREVPVRTADLLDINTKLVRVPTIIAFNDRGEMKPLYFSYHGLRLKIENVHPLTQRGAIWMDYAGEVFVSGQVWHIRLSYNAHTRQWAVRVPMEEDFGTAFGGEDVLRRDSGC